MPGSGAAPGDSAGAERAGSAGAVFPPPLEELPEVFPCSFFFSSVFFSPEDFSWSTAVSSLAGLYAESIGSDAHTELRWESGLF